MSVQSVDRALEILSLFSAASPRLGITDMSKSLGLAKPTIHGLVRTLTTHGFLAQDLETKKYCLGLKIHELGTILAGTLKINQVGGGPAQALAKATGLVARIAIWDQESVLVTLNLFPEASSVHYHQFGPRIPGYCTGLGKAILAFLPPMALDAYLERQPLARLSAKTVTDPQALAQDLSQCRARGYSTDREECVSGIACLGAPIFDFTGAAVGAMSISGSPGQVFGKDTENLAFQLTRTAAQISAFMGWRHAEPAQAALG